MVRTKRITEFVESFLAIFVQWEHNGKGYIEYLRSSKGGDEFDIRDWFIKPIFELLGYEKGDFNHEHPLFSGKPDFFIRPTMFPPLVTVETKPTSAGVKEFFEARTQQLFPAMKELHTDTGVLTNGVRLEVYHRKGEGFRRVVELDISALVIAFRKKGLDGVSNDHIEKLSKLLWLKKSTQTVKDEDFYPPPSVDISEPTQFDMLLDDLADVIETVKIDVEERFDIYAEDYRDYEDRAKRLSGLEMRQLLKVKKEAINTRRCLEQWAIINNADLRKIESVRAKFVTESMYILVNRILLIRIAEDKEIIKRRISNGAIRDYKEYVKEINVNYSKLLDEGYKTIESVYEHLFKRDIFDWYNPDSELLMKVLFTFNRYNFAKVDRDILGNLYQKYIDKEERKRLGQFYTPHEIVDYILDSVGYTSTNEIENKTLLDPACGSGGFLVPAVNRLVTRLRNKNYDPESILAKVRDNIYGFDVNPFAAHLTETNLLFQVIDLISQAKKKNPAFKLERFNICITDSLKIPGRRLPSPAPNMFDTQLTESVAIEDTEVVKDIKLKRGRFSGGMDIVVGNPPWGIKFEDSFRDELMLRFKHIHVRTPESSNYFIGLAIELLQKEGYLGMIVPNNLLFQHELFKTREFLLKKNLILKIVNIGDSVFEDVITPSCIIAVQRDGEKCLDNLLFIKDLRKVNRHNLREAFQSDKNFESYKQREVLEIKDFVFQSDAKTSRIIQNVLSHKMTLGQISDEIASGISTGGDNVFRIESTLAKTSDFEPEPLKPVLVGREISAYYTPKDSSHVIIYATKHFDPISNPKIFQHLLPHEAKLSLKRETKKGLIPWYSLHWPRYPELFHSPKILCRQTADTLVASVDSQGYYVLDSILIIQLKKDSGYSENYITALLNSKLLRYVYAQLTQEKDRVFAQVKSVNLRKLPIAQATAKEQTTIEKRVDQLMQNANEIEDAKTLVANINLLLQRRFPGASVLLSDSAFVAYVNIEEHLGKTKISRKKRRIFLSAKNFIDLSDEAIAAFVELAFTGVEEKLRGLTKAEVLRLIEVPKTAKIVREALDARLSLIASQIKLKKQMMDIEEEVNDRVYKLYGLSNKEIAVVEKIQGTFDP